VGASKQAPAPVRPADHATAGLLAGYRAEYTKLDSDENRVTRDFASLAPGNGGTLRQLCWLSTVWIAESPVELGDPRLTTAGGIAPFSGTAPPAASTVEGRGGPSGTARAPAASVTEWVAVAPTGSHQRLASIKRLAASYTCDTLSGGPARTSVPRRASHLWWVDYSGQGCSVPSANTSQNGRGPAAIYAFRRLPACRRDASRRPPRSTAVPTPRVRNEMRMRGTIAPKTPSKTMPSRTPMMIVFVMSRFLVEERRIRRPWGPRLSFYYAS
jgi:hypothetical protein